MKLTKEQQRLLKECKWFLSTIGYVAVSKKVYVESLPTFEEMFGEVINEQSSQYQMPLLSGTNQE